MCSLACSYIDLISVNAATLALIAGAVDWLCYRGVGKAQLKGLPGEGAAGEAPHIHYFTINRAHLKLSYKAEIQHYQQAGSAQHTSKSAVSCVSLLWCGAVGWAIASRPLRLQFANATTPHYVANIMYLCTFNICSMPHCARWHHTAQLHPSCIRGETSTLHHTVFVSPRTTPYIPGMDLHKGSRGDWLDQQLDRG